MCLCADELSSSFFTALCPSTRAPPHCVFPYLEALPTGKVPHHICFGKDAVKQYETWLQDFGKIPVLLHDKGQMHGLMSYNRLILYKDGTK